MKKEWLLLGALVCLIVGNTASAAIISGGSHELAPGGVYSIPITTSGDGELVWGLDLYIEIVGGGPGAPKILGVDLESEGTLFHGNNEGATNDERFLPWAYQATITAVGFNEIPLAEEAVLGWLQIDTHDTMPGRYELRLKNVLGEEDFSSDYVSLAIVDHIGATVYDGVLNVVPEPSSILLGGIAGLALWSFGRVRKRQN